MSESRHTPGPWVYRPCEFDDWGWVRAGANGGLVAIAKGGSRAGSGDELEAHRARGTDPYEANARLIAAAPELLAALKDAGRFIANGIELGYIRIPDPDTRDSAHDTPGIIEAAIAKAEGRG